MGVTRLKRKEKRNRAIAKAKVSRVKQLMARPVIKNIDIEEIKKTFAAKAEPKAPKKAKKAEATEATETTEE